MLSTYNSATGWAVIALFCGTGSAWWEEVKGECRRAFFSVCLTEAGRLPHRVHRGCWGCSAACVWSIFLPSEAFWGSLGFPSEDEAVLVACESAVFVWDRSQISAGNSTARGADLKPHQLPANASQCFSVEEKQCWMILQHRGVFPNKIENEKKGGAIASNYIQKNKKAENITGKTTLNVWVFFLGNLGKFGAWCFSHCVFSYGTG